MPQRSLCTEQFVHIFFWHRKKKCTPIFLHAELLPRTVFTQQQLFRTEVFTNSFLKCTAIITDRWFLHRKFSAQKSYAQKVFRRTVFLHTTVFIHRCLYTEDELHTKTCAHNTLLHATSSYAERFCSPFLITYLSCSFSSNSSRRRATANRFKNQFLTHVRKLCNWYWLPVEFLIWYIRKSEGFLHECIRWLPENQSTANTSGPRHVEVACPTCSIALHDRLRRSPTVMPGINSASRVGTKLRSWLIHLIPTPRAFVCRKQTGTW